jgi:hypothetical protein
MMWDATTRNPLFLFLLFGLFLLRYAQRTFLSLLLNAPPRNTRVNGPAPQCKRPELQAADCLN